MAGSVASANRFSETIHAVVVGISDYEGTGLKRLPECAREAKAFADTLSSSRMCGVPKAQVHHVPDAEATCEAILAALRKAADEADPDHVVVFYFAGHGEASADGFILRTGPRKGDPRDGLTREDIAQALGSSAARGILVILDCCGGAGFAENAPKLFFTLSGHDFRILLSASRAGESSWELEDHGSLFTRYLLSVLRGEEGFGRSGSIFLNDLFDYLKTNVASDARRLLPPGETQTPIFAGSHAGDPLLFLNRDLTLDQISVRTVRVTREMLFRRVAMTAVGTLGTSLLIAMGYWAFLDSHRYLEMTGDRISLVHGYPGLSGFGLPQTEWVYGEGPQDLAEDAPAPRQNKPLVFSSEDLPEAELLTVLRPPGRARVRIWAGDRTGARRDLVAAALERKPSRANDLEFLPETVVAEDAEELEKLVKTAGPEDPIEPFVALGMLDPNRAIAAWQASPASSNGGLRLNAMTRWQGACDASVQAWYRAALSDRSRPFEYLTALRAITRTKGCRVDAAEALSSPANYIRDSFLVLRQTNAEGAETIRSVLAGMLGSPDAAVRHRPEHAERLAKSWRYIGPSACGSWLLEPDRSLPEGALIDAAVAAARDCGDARLEAKTTGDRLAIVLRTGSEERQVVAYSLDRSLGPEVLAGVNALVERQAVGLIVALRAVMAATVNSDVRIAIAKVLRLLKADGSRAMAYALPNSPELDRELLRWLSSTDRLKGSVACVDLILTRPLDSQLLAALALVPIETSDRRRMLAFAETQGEMHRTIVSVLLASGEDAAALLISPEPAIRAQAQSYALARTDRDAVFASARSRSIRADPGLERSVIRLRRLSAMAADLETTPDFAVEWRARGIDEFEIDDPGLAVAFEQILDERRRRSSSASAGSLP